MGLKFTRLLALAGALLATTILADCASRRPPVLEPLRALESRNPVVLVPGITGTRLRDGETGRIVWGNARSLFLPRDGGYALVRPVDPGRAADTLEPDSAVIGLRLLGMIKVDIYASLIELMTANGYRLGDLDDPGPGDTFFLFPYDWRADNVEAARELAARLDDLRRARGDETLTVDLICQSNAARIARYLIKYGDATLEQAETGEAGPPARIEVDRLILVGNANGGGIGTLEDLNRGRSYVPLIGRRFLPETAFTFVSLYEALPAHRRDLFFDEQGRPLDVDLYDAESWRRYGWSVYGGAASKRLARGRNEEVFGDEESRAAFLQRALDRARRFQHLLMQDVEGFGGTRYYLLQNLYRPTPERAMLTRKKNGEWRTLFGSDRRIRRDPHLFTLANSPGDGHATQESQLWLSPQERAAIVEPPVIVPAYHRKIVLHPATHRRILEFLLE